MSWKYPSFSFFLSSLVIYLEYGFNDTPSRDCVAQVYETKVEGADCARNRGGRSDIRREPVSSALQKSNLVERSFHFFFPLSPPLLFSLSTEDASGIEMPWRCLSRASEKSNVTHGWWSRLKCRTDRSLSTTLLSIDTFPRSLLSLHYRSAIPRNRRNCKC